MMAHNYHLHSDTIPLMREKELRRSMSGSKKMYKKWRQSVTDMEYRGSDTTVFANP